MSFFSNERIEYQVSNTILSKIEILKMASQVSNSNCNSRIKNRYIKYQQRMFWDFMNQNKADPLITGRHCRLLNTVLNKSDATQVSLSQNIYYVM